MGPEVWRRWGVLGLGLGCGALVLAMGAPEGLGTAGHRTLAIGAAMIVWWLFEALPIGIVALVPLLAFPILGVAPLSQVIGHFASSLLVLILAGMFLGHAIEKVRLHERFTAWMLAIPLVRQRPRRVVFALMVVTAALSTMMSNTATALMMMPLGLALGARCFPDDARARSGFALGVAWASNIGGVATIIGTPPNAICADFLEKKGVAIGFVDWMLVGAPIVALALPMAWWFTCFRLVPDEDRAVEPPEIPAWREGEAMVLATIGAALVAWVSRVPVSVGSLSWPGWSHLLPGSGSDLDALVAVVAAGWLLIVPAGEGFVLEWRSLERSIPWSLLLLLGGGLALAGEVERNGVSAWIGSMVTGTAGWSPWSVLAFVSFGMTFLTEVTSNMASTQMSVPILWEAAPRLGVDPLALVVTATIAASCGFMLPMGTAPNALATEKGGVRPLDMALGGFGLNLGLATVVFGVSALWIPWVLHR